jgi:hypothetical protein
MNLYKISDEQAIDLDRVIDVTIIDLPDQNNKIQWALMFELSVVDQVKIISNNPDEDEIETSHTQTNEYFYVTRISDGYETLELAKKQLDKIIKQTNWGEK